MNTYSYSGSNYGGSPYGASYSFHTKVVGVTFNDRQRFIPGLRTGEELQLRRERWNQYDSNAIAVFDGRGNQLGYISKELASDLARRIDAGAQFRVTVACVTGGNGYTYGVNILMTKVS